MNINREWIYSINEIRDFVFEFYDIFKKYKIFCINGTLGAGKTTFVKEFCKLILKTEEEVTSPTFSIVNQYNDGEIFHLDLYRLNTIEEIADIGIEEILYSGKYCFIEWFDKIKNLLPNEKIVYCEIQIIDLNRRKFIAKTI